MAKGWRARLSPFKECIDFRSAFFFLAVILHGSLSTSERESWKVTTNPNGLGSSVVSVRVKPLCMAVERRCGVAHHDNGSVGRVEGVDGPHHAA